MYVFDIIILYLILILCHNNICVYASSGKKSVTVTSQFTLFFPTCIIFTVSVIILCYVKIFKGVDYNKTTLQYNTDIK